MSLLPFSRTKRNLLKVVSLGLAGLLAGLLSGCTDSPDTTVSAPYTHLGSDSFSPDATAQTQTSHLPPSIEATQIPALRHPPTSRSLQYGTVRMAAMAAPPSHNRS
jgi:hypothetical protein